MNLLGTLSRYYFFACCELLTRWKVIERVYKPLAAQKGGGTTIGDSSTG